MFEQLFEFLFKYRPLVFQQGDLAFTMAWPAWALGLAAAVAGAVTWATYARVGARSGRRDRFILASLRLGVLAVLLFSLSRPVLVVRAVEPQRNFLGVLLDDSKSLQITDVDGQPRSAFIQQAFTAEAPLRVALSERFALRFFRFSSSAERVSDPEALTFSGTQTHVGQALERAREELTGVPLSGLVLMSDGADNAQEAVVRSLLSLQAGAVPVFTVGLGRERLDRDIQLSRVDTPARVLKGASLLVDVVVSQTGYAGSTVPLQVEDEGRIVAEQRVRLPADGEPASVRVSFPALEAGPRLFRFRVPPQPGEMVPQNNSRDVLIVVENRREKILYFEGEPRFEVKFVRRAVADDENLQVVVLQRTAENKFLRLDVDAADDLLGGFPKTREELFAYRGIILGSVEASAFTPDQLRMIADFVDQRGGGLLMLGGRRAFAEGGYGGTPVADVLPVVIEPAPSGSQEPFFAELTVRPTRAGLTHAATQIAATEQESADRWKTLPPLTSVNPVRAAKPGATVLLTGTAAGVARDFVVLAYQRYGAGKTLALPVQDSWLWQMHADVAVDDLTHELLWRRLLRWLVDDVPERVRTTMTREQVEPGEPVQLAARVRDAAYLDVNNARVNATVLAPSGARRELSLGWVVDRDGEYRAAFVPDEDGIYEVQVEAAYEGAAVGSDVAYVRSGPSDNEYFDAGMRQPLLGRIAEETGGRFYTPDTVASLPDDVRYIGQGVTVVEERELWDMPVLLILLVGLAGGEWTYRRARGLA